MNEKISILWNEIESFKFVNEQSLELFRIKYLGTKGVVKSLFSELKRLSSAEKKDAGLLINDLKSKTELLYDTAKQRLSSLEKDDALFDFTRPGTMEPLGSRHPLSIVRGEIIDIFSRIGYVVSEGPEIEDDWHNFSALNFPPEHPARDMQDTFFVDSDLALRTHTSSVQVRVMETSQPPIRTISPGRVYRNEAISARAHCFFHQVEGLYIDKGVSFADLKQTLLYFAIEFFGDNTKIRLRPSYFPFTEPSAEVDISCSICNAKGCNVCKHTGWLEILGCGLVDPNVLLSSGIDPTIYSGFAFGMGIERISQLKYKINDLRLYSENDIRFLSQFASEF